MKYYSFILCFQPLHTLKVQKFYKQKDADLSERKRNDGNKAFQSKQNQAALSLYSQAIVKAPHEGKFSFEFTNLLLLIFFI